MKVWQCVLGLKVNMKNVRTSPLSVLYCVDPVIFFPVGLNYFPLCYVAEFAKYAESKVDVTVPYLIYILLNCVGVGLALYKCQTLGLLPSEWGAIATAPTNLEFSVGSATPRS